MKVVGIDGCPAGWIAIICKDSDWSYGVFSSIEELVFEISDADYYLIDMPMGLGDNNITRNLDSSMKKLLRPRHSTIFQAPCRQVLDAENYNDANRINRHILGKGLTIQSWNIVPKIREIDDFLRNTDTFRERFYESSPELCFAGFNDGEPLKTKKSRPEGKTERKSIISKTVSSSLSTKLIDEILYKYRRYQVRLDDILDAFILCIAGWQGAANGFKEIINDNYPEDSFGVPLRILYFFENQ